MAKRRGTIWSNLRWIHPQRTGYGTGTKALREKLRYFTYRDDRNVKAPSGGRRWIDHGLGGTHGDILKNCQTLSSDDRLAWTVMFSPKPRLMELIAEPDRRSFIEDLTEDVIEGWMEARGYVDVPFAYVVHDRATTEEGLQQLHSHAILPGTLETVAGRERFDNRPSDLRDFNTLVEDTFELHMDRHLGREWRVAWAAIQREEALKKFFKAHEVEHLPDNLAELAERLHATGYDSQRIPEGISSPGDFENWLAEIEMQEPDLDAWFGGD